MNFIRCVPLLLIIFLEDVSAHDGFSRNFIVSRDNNTFRFRCEGTIGSSSIRTTFQNGKDNEKIIFEKRLDDIDDCGQASWVMENVNNENSSTLVLLNSGRSGLNAQYSAFFVSRESIAFAGYVPVSAERVSDFEYRSYSSETGSVWERTDALLGGKFSVTNELRLILRGAVCVNKAGEVMRQESCGGTQIVARLNKAICVRYQFHRGRLLPAAACARLAEKM